MNTRTRTPVAEKKRNRNGKRKEIKSLVHHKKVRRKVHMFLLFVKCKPHHDTSTGCYATHERKTSLVQFDNDLCKWIQETKRSCRKILVLHRVTHVQTYTGIYDRDSYQYENSFTAHYFYYKPVSVSKCLYERTRDNK